MQPVNPFKSSAVAVFRASFVNQQQLANGPAATPAGATTPSISNPAALGGPAEVKLADDFFSIHHRDVNEIKMDLFERLGKAFGLDMADFEDPKDYARELRLKVEVVRRDENGARILKEIEHELGLDKLGISIDTVISAINDPDGEADETLTDAIKKSLKEDSENNSKHKTENRSVSIDEAGLYSILF